MGISFLRYRQQPWLSRLWYVPPAKALAMGLRLCKRTPNFKPQHIDWQKRAVRTVQRKFTDTRDKLLGIIGRHEKIAAIILAAKARWEHFEILPQASEDDYVYVQRQSTTEEKPLEDEEEEVCRIDEINEYSDEVITDSTEDDESVAVELITQDSVELLHSEDSDATLRAPSSDATLCNDQNELSVSVVLQKIMNDIKNLDLLGEDSFAKELENITALSNDIEPEHGERGCEQIASDRNDCFGNEQRRDSVHQFQATQWFKPEGTNAKQPVDRTEYATKFKPFKSKVKEETLVTTLAGAGDANEKLNDDVD